MHEIKNKSERANLGQKVDFKVIGIAIFFRSRINPAEHEISIKLTLHDQNRVLQSTLINQEVSENKKLQLLCKCRRRRQRLRISLEIKDTNEEKLNFYLLTTSSIQKTRQL